MSKLKHINDAFSAEVAKIKAKETAENNKTIFKIRRGIEDGITTITQRDLQLLIRANKVRVLETPQGTVYKYNNIQLRVV